MAATIGREQAAPLRMVPHRVVPGLELVEDVLFRLAVGDEPDLAAVLLQLCDALGAQGACICESASGEPLIMASAGDLKDMPVAALREFVLRAPSAPMPAEMAAFPGEPRLTGVVLPSSAGKRSALVVWARPRWAERASSDCSG